MALKTTKIRAGDWDVCHRMEEFCQANFGPGGVQPGRRWFYRLLGAEFETVVAGGIDYRVMARPDYTAVYFRDPADAVWFTLKFGADRGHV
jgi:hypothetical protein